MNQLEKQVLRLIGESVTSPDVFTDANIAPIRDSINDAIAEIVMVTGGHKDRYSIPLVASKTFYRLRLAHGSFAWVSSCWLMQSKRPLAQTDTIALNRNDPRWMVRTGTPEAYAPIGTDLIALSPKPSASSDVLEVDMVVIPEPYTTDKDPIKLRKEYRWAVVSYAVSEYYAGRGDAKRATEHYREYAETLGLRTKYFGATERILQLDTVKQAPEPPQVVTQ